MRQIPEEADFVPVSICVIFDNHKICDKFIKLTNEAGVPFGYFSDKNLTTYTTFRDKKSWNEYNIPYCFAEYTLNECKYTYELSNRVAWLSVHPLWSHEEMNYIAEVINKYYEMVV